MKRLFGNKKGEGHDFWMSYTDMMSAFLIVFMIGCIYAYGQFQKKSSELDIAKSEFDRIAREFRIQNPDSLINQIFKYAQIVDSLNSQKLSNEIERYRSVFIETEYIKPVFDFIRGSIKLIDKTPGGELFESGEYSFFREKDQTVLPLKPYLERIYPELVSTTMDIARSKNVNIELRIEGHTDPKWNGLTRGSTSSYLKNMKLSSDRANAVYELILNGDKLSDSQRKFLMEHMISVGYSFSERIEKGNISNEAIDGQSRRIEFRIISK